MAKTGRRKLIIQISLGVIWIVLGIVIFMTSRGHTLLVDNKNIDYPQIRAPDLIMVTVNKNKPLEFFRGDRDMFQAGGSNKIRIEFSDGTPPFETRFRLPLGPDMFILSIPKMLNGIEPWIEVFYTQPESRTPDDDEEIVFE